MWRVGLPPQEVMRLAAEPERLEGLEICYVLSHLACSEQQIILRTINNLKLFNTHSAFYPKRGPVLQIHMAFSLGPQYHFDLVRPGRSLYGLAVERQKPME
jgi:alanine racemase